MRAFGSFRKPPPVLPSNSVEPIPGARGPVTSRQAAAWVRAAALAVAPHTLHLVQSGRPILPDGRSHTWEFLLRFPGLGCAGLLSVQPVDPDGDPELPSLGLWREFLPLSDDAVTPLSFPATWSFADSPDVVAALARAGADFDAGPTDVGIRSFFDGAGTLHWRTDRFDGRTIQVPDGQMTVVGTPRPLAPTDGDLLELAMVDNVNWATEQVTLTDVRAAPELAHYTRLDPDRGDFGLVAEREGEPVGVAWALFLPADDPGYGFVEDGVPELALWVRADVRGRGIGRHLLRALQDAAAARGLTALSLSVEDGNLARLLYESEGFEDVPGREADGVMLWRAGPGRT